MKFKALPLLLLALVFASPARAEDKTYRIKLDREDQKGAKTKEVLSGSSSQGMTVSVDDKVVNEKTEKLAGKLSAVREVLEVNEHHKATKLKFTIDKLVLQKDDEAASTPLASGAELLVQRDKDGKISGLVNDKEVDEDVAKLLDILVDLPKDKEPEMKADEAFGTDQARKPGSAWALDIGKVFKSMAGEMPFEVDAEASNGKMAFPEVKTVDGVECCRVQADIAFKVKIMKDMPAEMKTKNAAVSVSVQSLEPVDSALPAFGGTMKLNVDFAGSMTTPEGTAALIKIKVVREKTGDIRPVK